MDSSSTTSSSSSVQQDGARRHFVTTLHTLPTTSSYSLEKSHLHPTSSTTNSHHHTDHTSSQKQQRWRNTLEDWTHHDTIHEDILLEMSQALDAIGWRKVFVDVTEEMPLRIPVLHASRSILRGAFGATNTNIGTADITLRRGEIGVWESRHIAQALALPDKVMSFPIGHNMMVAFSRTPFSSFLYKGGRPIVDQLAREFIDEIFKWRLDD